MICGCPESEYYKQKIEHTTSCEHFLHNPAQDLFTEAIVASAMLEESAQHEHDAKELIRKLEEALKLGLPQDDEVIARFMLGETYSVLLRHKPQEALPMTQELRRAVQEMETAVIIDSQEGYGKFLDRLNSARLQRLAGDYMIISQRTQQDQGTDYAIRYVKQKLELFDYLPNPPSLLLLNLGELYESKGETANARAIFMKVLESAKNPVDGFDSEVRRSIESRIQQTKSQEKKKSGCFIATAVYGNENAPEVEALRRLRDQLLIRSRMGRAFIIFYYLVSPSIAMVIKPSEHAKSFIRTILLRPAFWLIKETTRGKEKKCRPNNLEKLH
jgi:tetratricopeptide (TPR) repeat protein